MVSGTRSHTFPVRKAPARSAEPIPVAKAPTAPQVTVWLSAPTTRSPGLTRPVSIATWKLIPPPTGRSSTPCSAAKASMRAWNPRVEGEVGGRVVVPGQEDPVGMADRRAAHGLEVLDGHGGGAVGAQDQVGRAHHDVPGPGLGPGMGREDLLGEGAGSHQAPARASMVRSTSSMRMSPMWPMRMLVPL